MVQVSFPLGSRSLTVYGLTQYDYGQELEVHGLPLPAVVECQISLQRVGGTTESLAGVVVDDTLTLAIPDTYLAQDTESDYTIYVYIYVTTESSGTTVYLVSLPVTARSMPDGYVPGETSPFAAVIEEITELVEEAQGAATLSESYAKGGTGTRTGEDTDNSKYYSEEARDAETGAADSAAEARASEVAAAGSASTAAAASTSAAEAKTAAEAAMVTATAKATEAANSASAAGVSAAAASASETAAGAYASTAGASAVSAASSASAAESSATSAASSASSADSSATAAAEALGDVTDAKQDALTAISGAQTTAVGAVTAEGTRQVGLVTAEGTTQKNAVQAKGTEVIASIPSDYTALSNSVSELKSDITVFTSNAKIEYETNKYYNTNLDPMTGTPSTSASATVRSAKIACQPGDKFTISGNFSGYRVYAFTDSNYNILARPTTTAIFNNEVITAPNDSAWLFLNDEHGNNSYYGVFITNRVSGLEEKVEIMEEELYSFSYSWEMPQTGNYVVNLGVKFEVGKNYIIYWENQSGEGSANLYTRLTASGASLETIKEGLHPGEKVNFAPTTNAFYLRVVATQAGTINVFVSGTFDYREEVLSEKIDVLKNEINIVPFVIFEYNKTMIDPAVDVALMDFSTNGKKTVIEQVYTLFDALVTNYPSYVTRYDAGALLNIEYPQYANGIPQPYTETHIIDYEGETPVTKVITFDTTPQYKAYMYKLSDGSNALSSANKKNLFIVCGVHGNEVAAPFNSYLLAKELCGNVTNEDILKLRASYNIYIVPYLNGYGCYHQTRCNANRIDINRNFPTSGWTFGGVNTIDSDGLCVYTGLEAGSEFETKIVMGLYNYIKPDVFIDHHNSGTGSTQFYSVVTNKDCANVVYQSLTDCAFSFIKNMPEYFGTAYKLFPSSDVSPATLTGTQGFTDRWAYEQGCIPSGTVEIFESINFLNGSVSVQDRFGADSFSVGEYTLRNMVLHLCDYGMRH